MMKAIIMRQFGAPEVMRLEEVTEAHRIVENNQIIGKIVLEPGTD